MQTTTNTEQSRLYAVTAVAHIVLRPEAPYTAHERLVLLAIANHMDARGESYPSTETIAAECGLSKRTVLRVLDGLERRHPAPLIEIQHRHRGKRPTSNIYRLRPDVVRPKAERVGEELWPDDWKRATNEWLAFAQEKAARVLDERREDDIRPPQSSQRPKRWILSA